MAAAVESFKKAGAQPYFDTAYGWAVFPNVAKAGMGIGGAGGVGEVFIRNEDGEEPKLVGTANVIQVTFGFQFGGQVYSEVVFFETQRDFETFTSGNFEFGAGADVVALTASAGAKATTTGAATQTSLHKNEASVKSAGYNRGMAVMTIALGGLMYSATVGGQKFNYKPISN